MDETEGVSNVDMTDNRYIPDHTWPYMREMFYIVCVKKGFLANALLRVYSVFLYYVRLPA